MKVIVKLLATYRKLLPPEAVGNVIEVEVPDGTTVADLMSGLGVPLNQESVFLINGLTPESLNQQLNEGDIVAAFSAIAGG